MIMGESNTCDLQLLSSLHICGASLKQVCAMQGPVPAMIMGEGDARDLQLAMQKAPGASHSRGRVALVDNLSPGTSLSGLLRLFEGFHMQEHAATLLPKVGKQLPTGRDQAYPV